MHPSLTILQDEALSFLRRDFELETLADDCLFTEGPVWNREGFYLFSDIGANAVYKVVPGCPKEMYIPNSGTANHNGRGGRPDHAGSNALAYYTDGTLLLCQHGDHRLARWDGQQLQSFIAGYNGRPFNSPNDLVVTANGRVFFSDPPYGLKDAKPNADEYQPVAAVYCWDAGLLTVVSDTYQYPNGVCLTPDGSELFICSNKPFEKFVSVYDAQTLAFKRIFTEENSDGIKCDNQGNVYLCNNAGLLVFNPMGKKLATIELPKVPANACWGGTSGKDLLVTAREAVFLLKGLLQ